MRAVILAGGIGSRLRPYTLSLPKPLLPVGDKPILEIIVQQLAKFGFNHLTMAVNHQADLFSAYFGDGGKWGVRITYSLEHQALLPAVGRRLISGCCMWTDVAACPASRRSRNSNTLSAWASTP